MHSFNLMSDDARIGRIELQLVKVLHTVISERSVSRAALKLGSTQPAVSAQLRRLRALTGDALLVRAGNALEPTEAALALLPAAARVLQGAQQLFGGHAPARAFEPAQASNVFRIAASDFLDPLFLPELVARVRERAPAARVELLALSADYDYRRALARGEVDLVIGNWLEPPGELHLGRLVTDEVVCLVAADHPALRRPRQWNERRYLDSEHIAPTAFHAGARGIIDDHLAARGLARRIVVRTSHFGLAPRMVARTQLVLTTGRQYCERYVDQYAVRVLACPVDFPPLSYYQLWHELTHASAAARWLRETVRTVAQELARR